MSTTLYHCAGKAFSFIWKVPAVAIALIVGILFISQAGWSGAEVVVNIQIMEWWDTLGTTVIFGVSAIVGAGTVFVIYRLAKHVLWVTAPVFLYTALVPGVWNGYMSGFDATRAQSLQHGYANAFALEHMSERGRYLTCNDDRIELSDDTKPVCARALRTMSGGSSRH
jgi:hypothetical protein